MSRPIKPKLIKTKDGSHTLYREDMDETYHSTRGAMGESNHVFITNGLLHQLVHRNSKSLHVLEVGFGTGLNALLSQSAAEEYCVSVYYQSLETLPLTPDVYTKLNYPENDEMQMYFMSMHEAPLDQQTRISSHFSLTKHHCALEAFAPDQRFDIIYFDAFAPSRQPDIWSKENLRKCYKLLNTGGILVTYCAQGQFKRDLASVGFGVETLPGAMGKKEMVRGRVGGS